MTTQGTTVRDTKLILGDLIAHMKYARHIESENRRETWREISDRSANMHIKKYPFLVEEIREAFDAVANKQVLPSMRCMQFGGEAIETKNSRMFNCALTQFKDVKSFQDFLRGLLCGNGMGFSVQRAHIENLPRVSVKDATGYEVHHTIEDTIEGWCDALGVLLGSYFGDPSETVVFHFDNIRPLGSVLKTSGGRAPGPEPLRKTFHNVSQVMTARAGKKLRSIDVHDIACYLAQCVHAGGIRRSSMISFFDRDDTDMLTCKSGDWWVHNGQRSQANNSAVFLRGKVTKEDFIKFWKVVKESGSGEPGIYFTNNIDMLSNPCVEASLYFNQYCNLSSINGAKIRTQEQLNEAARLAARIGTIQASYTDFSYISADWKSVTDRGALLGVSITGIGEGHLDLLNLKEAALESQKENRRVAKLLGINPSDRITLIKPEGTSSLVLGTCSGIHDWYGEYYWRSIRVGKQGQDGATYRYLLETVPELIEDCLFNPDTTAIFRMPIKANDGGHLRSTHSALDLLERVKKYHQEWVVPGHNHGDNTHNVSCTVSILPEEWDEVGEWMWLNRRHYNGIAVLPYDGGTYRQAPFMLMSEEEYKKYSVYAQSINTQDIIENIDNVHFEAQPACAGGKCDI
jgi:ribonucleoside-triphosphate reductase